MHRISKRHGITILKPRFRTPKRDTRLYAEAKFGERRSMNQFNQNQSQSHDDVQAVADSLSVSPKQKLAYTLFDTSRDLSRLGHELMETEEIEPAAVKHLLRRLAAAYLASIDLVPLAGQADERQALEALMYPHRTKGMVIP
jgi:hypothetical protein